MSKRRDEAEGWKNKRHKIMCEKSNECEGDGSSKQMIRDVSGMESGERLSVINLISHILLTTALIVLSRGNDYRVTYRMTGELSRRCRTALWTGSVRSDDWDSSTTAFCRAGNTVTLVSLPPMSSGRAREISGAIFFDA
jgi:hypothetical protein